MKNTSCAWIPCLLILLICSPWSLMGQVVERLPEDHELAERIEDRFEVIVLSNGLLLEARRGSRLSAIEVSPGRITLDGKRIEDRSSLFEALGDDARLVVELSGLERDRFSSLFGGFPMDELGSETEAPELIDEESVDIEPVEPIAPPRPAAPRPRAASDREIPIRIGDVEVGRATVSSDTKVVVGGELEIEEHERYRDVVVVGGSLAVEGEIRGDAAVFGGPAYVDGRVTGDVMAIGGSVELGDRADVEGDVTSIGGEVEREAGARVGGKISELSMLGPMLDIDSIGSIFEPGHDAWDRSLERLERIWSRVWHLMGLAFLAFMACLVRVLVPGTVDRIDETVVAEPWKAAFVGFAAILLFLPILVMLALVLTISIIGIPLLLLLPFLCLAFLLAVFVGFVGVAQSIGHWLEKRFSLSLGAFSTILIGVASIYVWAFLGKVLGIGGWPLTFFAIMLAVFGTLLEVAAWSVGLGAVILSRAGTSRRPVGFSGPDGGGYDPSAMVVPAISVPDAPSEDADPLARSWESDLTVEEEVTESVEEELDLSDLELPSSADLEPAQLDTDTEDQRVAATSAAGEKEIEAVTEEEPIEDEPTGKPRDEDASDQDKD